MNNLTTINAKKARREIYDVGSRSLGIAVRAEKPITVMVLDPDNDKLYQAKATRGQVKPLAMQTGMEMLISVPNVGSGAISLILENPHDQPVAVSHQLVEVENRGLSRVFGGGSLSGSIFGKVVG